MREKKYMKQCIRYLEIVRTANNILKTLSDLEDETIINNFLGFSWPCEMSSWSISYWRSHFLKSRNNLWPDNDFYLLHVVYLRNSPFWWRLEVQITMQKPQKHPKPLSDHPVWSFTVVRILVKVTSALSIIHFLYVVLMENSSNNVWLLKWLLFVWKALELT